MENSLKEEKEMWELSNRVMEVLRPFGEISCSIENHSSSSVIKINGVEFYSIYLWNTSIQDLDRNGRYLSIRFQYVDGSLDIYSGYLIDFDESVVLEVYNRKDQCELLRRRIKNTLIAYKEAMNGYESHLMFMENIREMKNEDAC
jgi:hypothetical protein